GMQPAGVAVADFNGDGRPDLAIANSLDNTISVLVNTAKTSANSPSFRPQQTFATGRSPCSVAVGDFTGDGKPDLVVGNSAEETISVLLNTTLPGADVVSFSDRQTFAAGMNQFVVVGDFNADGKPDVAVSVGAYSTNAASILLNTTE